MVSLDSTQTWKTAFTHHQTYWILSADNLSVRKQYCKNAFRAIFEVDYFYLRTFTNVISDVLWLLLDWFVQEKESL